MPIGTYSQSKSIPVENSTSSMGTKLLKNKNNFSVSNFMSGSESPHVDQPNSSPPSEINTIEEEKRHTILNINEVEVYKKNAEMIANIYIGDMTYYSTTLDLIALYLKGQKLIYIESKTLCEQQLYCLMLPAILISAGCTVLSLALKSTGWGSILISSLTGTNSFILSIVTYLKLDAKSEAHKTTSYQFDKLQTLCDFYSGKTLMLHDENLKTNIRAFVENIEKKVSEIKDVNQFVIPELIRRKYAGIYGYNVFSVMKKYKTDRNLDIQQLIRINKLLNDFREPGVRGNKSIYSMSYSDLEAEKDRLIDNIIKYRDFGIKMNNEFNEHIYNYNKKKFVNIWGAIRNCFKT
jgi:hypothetical protein